jgi:hypothetical protein
MPLFSTLIIILGGKYMDDKFIKWFEDDELSIEFSEVPHVCIRYILPSSTDIEKASIKRFPFINKRKLDVRLYDKEKEEIYDFAIPKSYCYDGASIPKFFHRVIGANTDNKFLIAALIHDWMCEHHDCVGNDRVFSSKVFNALLEVSEVNPFKRFLMKHSVNIFQIFQGWDET